MQHVVIGARAQPARNIKRYEKRQYAPNERKDYCIVRRRALHQGNASGDDSHQWIRQWQRRWTRGETQIRWHEGDGVWCNAKGRRLGLAKGRISSSATNKEW